MVSKGLGHLKSDNVETENEEESSSSEQPPPFSAWEQPFAYGDVINSGLFECEPYFLANEISRISCNEPTEFDDLSAGDLGSWDFDNLPSLFNDPIIGPSDYLDITTYDSTLATSGTIEDSNLATSATNKRAFPNLTKKANVARRNGRQKSSTLGLEEIQKYFEVPITKAAKQLNVGVTVLKKRCRELNIKRWPHRKIKSLQSIIHNVKELGLLNEVEMLEEHKRMVEKVPEMELTERTKKLRQACFKANYKKRRSKVAPSHSTP